MSINQITPSTPQTRITGHPSWYHSGGDKVRVKGHNGITTPARQLVIGSQNLDMTIAKNHHPQDKEQGEWFVEYQMDHGPTRTWTKGIIIMTTQDLKTAFGLSEECEADDGQGILDVCGGDVAKEGKYIRYKQFLNIPGPGYGWDGDSNVSMRVTKDMKIALEKFMAMFAKD